jgi:glucose/arabinose dehydrogenase
VTAPRVLSTFPVALFLGCSSSSPAAPEPTPPDAPLRAVEIASGLAAPVQVTAPSGDARLFVVEQPGRIRVIENGQLRPDAFLDITANVLSGGERGLLSLAFHPEYAANGHLYVNYTDAGGATRVERYRISSDRNVVDAGSAQLILRVAQPFSNHNGGMIAFGPDGMLYIGMGDGGSGGDPLAHGQNRSSLLGAMLRLDVDAGDPYGIPPDNPYFDVPGARPEVWAIGLRNPWRFSFDRTGGSIYIADVGQNRREEINARPATEGGLNYGWNVMEGSLCFNPPSGCQTEGLIMPVHEYDNPAEGCSVTGGYVYRGSDVPELVGHYFYGDYCRPRIRSFRLTSGGQAVDHQSWDVGISGNVASFGEDSAGELYVVVHQGRVYRLES